MTGTMAHRGQGSQRILVIKHGALGDFIMAMGPFQAIRRHHSEDHVTLLTTAPFVALAEKSGYFDEVWQDDRPRPLNIGAWLRLRAGLRAAGFERVYDLQTSARTSMYFRLLGRSRRPEWSGIARGCSHPHANPKRSSMHTIERQTEQLALAGIAEVLPPELSWLDADVSGYGLEELFVLLVPGGAAHRLKKRWPARAYAELARRIVGLKARPVLLGTKTEAAVLGEIGEACPSALDLTGRTPFAEMAGLARRAAGAVGNDTGPMHLIAAVGCPSLVLFSADSKPEKSAPRGPSVKVLRAARLESLSVDRVFDALNLRGREEAGWSAAS